MIKQHWPCLNFLLVLSHICLVLLASGKLRLMARSKLHVTLPTPRLYRPQFLGFCLPPVRNYSFLVPCRPRSKDLLFLSPSLDSKALHRTEKGKRGRWRVGVCYVYGSHWVHAWFNTCIIFNNDTGRGFLLKNDHVFFLIHAE